MRSDDVVGCVGQPVARRYAVNTNRVFIRLKDERYTVAPDEVGVARFLAVEVIDATAESQAGVAANRTRAPSSDGRGERKSWANFSIGLSRPRSYAKVSADLRSIRENKP